MHADFLLTYRLCVCVCLCLCLCLCVIASRWLSYGAAVPVLGLAHVPRHTHVQTLLPQTYSPGGQMARGIRRRRGTHCGALPVSYTHLTRTLLTTCLWPRSSTSFVSSTTLSLTLHVTSEHIQSFCLFSCLQLHEY